MLSNQNAYTSLEQLREWFFSVGKPYWSLFGSIDDNLTIVRRNKMMDNTNIQDLEKSWLMLESQIQALSSQGGGFTIRVDNHTLFKNAYTARLNLYASRANPTGSIPNHSIAGIGSPDSPYMSRKEAEDMLNIDRLERKVEDLEAAHDDAINGGMIMNVVNKVIESGLLEKMGMKLVGPAAALSGFDSKEDDGANDEMIMTKAFSQIEVVFPNITEFISALGSWVESNPEMAKNMFSQMKNNPE